MGVAVAMEQFAPPPPLPIAEQTVYDALCEAAAIAATCPLNLDLEMLVGCSSGSTVPKLIARLEAKGLIRVLRFQRFRRVQIVATGEWTARSPSQHVEHPHVPRGARTNPQPASGKLAKRARNIRG